MNAYSATHSTSFAEDKCQTAVGQFKKITRAYALFHLIFLGVAFLEVFFFLLFFSFFAKSSLLALSLASIFFTVFTYFVLMFYFQSKKPEQLLLVKENYLEASKRLIRAAPESSEYHMELADSIFELVSALQNQEYFYYSLPKSFEILNPLLEKLSVWTYWLEVHKMKEMLLLDAIEEHIILVKANPTQLETHGNLAQGYISLAQLYKGPEVSSNQWVSPAYASFEMKQKYKTVLQRALEEYKILCYFSPKDPWVYSQLAVLYHDLELPQQEIEACETLRRLVPDSKEVLLRLGSLYFAQGQCALGLTIYDTLKNENATEAEALISHYDAYLRA